MISIRDADKQKLEYAIELIDSGAEIRAKSLIFNVLDSIEDLSQQAPVLEPRIVQMTEEDKRICYPERYK